MKNILNILLLDVAALLLGMTLTLAFAPYEIFPFAILAPAGLLALSLNASPRRAFWLGFVFGIGWFSTGVYWVFHSIHVFGGVSSLLSGVITGGLIVALAIFPATVGYLTNRYFPAPSTAKIVYAYPAIWVFLEWIRSFLFTGFPWLFLGYSQTNSPLKGFAPILSVYGVSLAVVATSALVINAVLKFKQQAYRAGYFNLFALMTIWIAGGLLTFIPWTKPEGHTIAVSLVQGNIPQELKWSPEHLQLSLDRYENLSEPLWAKDKIIIWPEAAVPVPLLEAGAFIEKMDKKAQASGAHLILGIPIKVPNGNGYYNAVVTLGADQDKKVYLKRRLVPFGEYVPFEQWFSRLFTFMDVPMSELVPGKIAQAPLTVNGIKILTSICYEIAFPELSNTNDPNIGFILTLTNDAWFGDSSAQAQHLQMAKMRAIELKRPVVFVSNDGITAVIDPNGKVESAAPTHAQAVLNSDVQPMQGLTPWMRNGVDPTLFLLVCLLITAIRISRKFVLRMSPEENKNYAVNNAKTEQQQSQQ